MRSIVLALITILTVGALAVIGVRAGFVDTESSNDNFVQTDTLDLILENPQSVGQAWGQSVLGTWHWQNMSTPRLMEPGDVLTSQVYLRAFGTTQADHVDINCVNVNFEPDWDTVPENEAEEAILGHPVDPSPNNGIYDKDTAMIIIGMTYHLTPIIWGEYNSYNNVYINDLNGDHRISLDELEAQGLHNLKPVPDSGIIAFSMTVKFANDSTPTNYNEYQGDETMMTLIFALVK